MISVTMRYFDIDEMSHDIYYHEIFHLKDKKGKKAKRQKNTAKLYGDALVYPPS